MASLSPSKPSMIHVFLTSKEAYMMAGGRSSVSSRVATSTSPAKKSNTHRSSSDEMKREMIMAKRQAKTINQLMGEEKSYKDELELTRMNWNYKNRFKTKNEKQMEFKGSMNSLIQSFRSAEKNVQAIKKRNEDIKLDGGSKVFNIQTPDESRKEDSGIGVFSKSQRSLRNVFGLDVTALDSKRNSMSSGRSAIAQAQKDTTCSDDFQKFNKILEDTESLCQDIIPDIRKLAQTKKMQDMQFKRDKIALIEVLRNPGNHGKKLELKRQHSSAKEKDLLHPYIRFLGYDTKEQVPNISKWSKHEQIESRYLFHQYTQIEKKSFQQIKDEQRDRLLKDEQLEKAKRDSPIKVSSPTLSRRERKSASSSREKLESRKKNNNNNSTHKQNFLDSYLSSSSAVSDQKGIKIGLSLERNTNEQLSPISKVQNSQKNNKTISNYNNFMKLQPPSPLKASKEHFRIKVGASLQDMRKMLTTEENNEEDSKFEDKNDRDQKGFQLQTDRERKSIQQQDHEHSFSFTPFSTKSNSNKLPFAQTAQHMSTPNINSLKSSPKKQFLFKTSPQHSLAHPIGKFSQDEGQKTAGSKDSSKLSVQKYSNNSSHIQQHKSQQISQLHGNSNKEEQKQDFQKKLNPGNTLEVPDFFNQMTLKDMNILRKQTEGLKTKTQDLLNNLGNPENTKPNGQKGVTSIKRQMLTYQEHKDDILDTWDRKQVQLKQKNRQEIKNIVEDHYKKQQQARQRAQQNGEDSEDEAEEEIIKSVQNQLGDQQSQQTDDKLRVNVFPSDSSSPSYQSPLSFSEQRNQNFQELNQQQQQQSIHTSEASTRKTSNALTYGQMKIKNMELIKHAKQFAAKSREAENSQTPINLGKSLTPLNIVTAVQSSRNGAMLSPSKFRQEHSEKTQETSMFFQFKRTTVFGEGEEGETESLKKEVNTQRSMEESLINIASEKEKNKESMQNTIKPIKRQQSQSQSPQQKGSRVNFELSKLFMKDKRNTNLKLLQEKQQQKNQVKEYLNQALTRFNKLHSSQSDRIMTQIQQNRIDKESNQVEVDFMQMTSELQRKEKEFQIMMESNSEEMIKRRKREDILFQTQQKIYSNKKFDPTRFFREEQVWKNTINEINVYTQGREDKIEKAKNALLHPIDQQNESLPSQAVEIMDKQSTIQKLPSQNLSLSMSEKD